jgi:hypothetical protein
MRRLLLVTLGLLVAGGAYAAPGWQYAVHPINMRSNKAYIFFRTTESNVGGCSTNDYYVVPNAYDKKSALSILLTAYTAGLTVDVYVSGCDPSVGRPVVTDVQLH